MRRALRILLVLFLLPFANLYSQNSYKNLNYPELRTVKTPDVKRIELKNRMILYLLEDHELPLINLSARIGAGSINDPAGKIGLASVAAAVMRTGGTIRRSGDEIDERLESIAGSVETGMRLTSGVASMSVLKENIDAGLEVLADILMHPAFPADKIELQKVRERSAIARRNDDANAIAFREFDKLIYGPQSVYAREPQYRTIDAITRADLIAFHRKYFHPNNVMIGVWGDFDAIKMAQRIEKAFAGWAPGSSEKPAAPPVDYKYVYTVNLVKKEDVNQSTVVVGHIGGLLNNPDYPALQVMNNILGGGFSSRLFRELRSRQGLAYSVFGEYDASYIFPGSFYAGAMTKSESTVRSIQLLQQEISRIAKEAPTDEELAIAKDTFLNSFVFNYENTGEVLNRMMTYEYYGYPKDFLEKTRDNIEKVTKADVLRVARKYLHPDQVQILVVGKPEDFDQPLSVLGKVNEIDITTKK